MSRSAPLVVAGIIFAIVALIHLYRLYSGFPIVINDTPVPLWGNVVGLIVAGGLSFWMFWASCCRRCH